MLFETFKDMKTNNIKIPVEISNKLMILHSYNIVKRYWKNKKDNKARRPRNRLLAFEPSLQEHIPIYLARGEHPDHHCDRGHEGKPERNRLQLGMRARASGVPTANNREIQNQNRTDCETPGRRTNRGGKNTLSVLQRPSGSLWFGLPNLPKHYSILCGQWKTCFERLVRFLQQLSVSEQHRTTTISTSNTEWVSDVFY